MINWLVHALHTPLRRAMAAEIEAQRASERVEVRALIGEMEDVLEKFSRVVAREAMRRSRAMKATLDEGGPDTAATAVATSHPPQDRKAALRARLFALKAGIPRREAQ